MTNEKKSGPQKILDKIRANSGGIHISRVPTKMKKQFIELANEEFCGDYGMAFRECFIKSQEYDLVKGKLLSLIKNLENNDGTK